MSTQATPHAPQLQAANISARSAVIGALLCLAMAALPAAATEKSISLYSQGLVELHKGRVPAAALLMERAVAADPDDPYAVYYRGVVRSRANDLDGAIADLRRALAIKPDLTEARLDLGVALVNRGSYDEAMPVLEEASRDPALRGNALLFLGIAKLRQGDAAASLFDLDQVVEIDPRFATTATYYRGIALRSLGRDADARISFEAVIAAKPGSELAAEAQKFLAVIEQTPAAGRRYKIYGGYGIDYDSNVVLKLDGESTESLGVETDSDVAMNLRLGGRYALWRGEDTAVSIGYELFQRIYLRLDDFNLQGHRPSLHWTGRWESLRFGLITQYEFYLLKTDPYLQRVGGQPWLAWQAGDWGRTELSYRVRWNDFMEPPPGGVPTLGLGGDFSNSEDALDAVDHQPRLRQYVYLRDPRRYVSLSYDYERRDATKTVGEQFDRNGHGVEIAAATPLPADLELFGSYAYHREDYDQGGRVDEPHEILVVLRWPLASWFALSVGYYGELHNSNQFEYDRHIASTGFDLEF